MSGCRVGAWYVERGGGSPRAAERRAERLCAGCDWQAHISFIYVGLTVYQSIHRLVDQKAQRESDPLSHSLPVEIVAKQRSYMVKPLLSSKPLLRT